MRGSLASTRWRRATLHARIAARLKVSAALRDTSSIVLQALTKTNEDEPSALFTKHGEYLRTLRNGVKRMVAVAAASREAQTKHAMEAHIVEAAAHGVSTSVDSADALNNLARWQQGDCSMYTANHVKSRMSLRMAPQVTDALQAFWEAALASSEAELGDTEGEGEWPRTRALSYEGYAMLLRRLYRTMIADYDPKDAARGIAEAWQTDAKGGSRITRVDFCNALFELCDTWSTWKPHDACSHSSPSLACGRTVRSPNFSVPVPVPLSLLTLYSAEGIDASQYAGLLNDVLHSISELDEEGQCRWRCEHECVFHSRFADDGNDVDATNDEDTNKGKARSKTKGRGKKDETGASQESKHSTQQDGARSVGTGAKRAGGKSQAGEATTAADKEDAAVKVQAVARARRAKQQRRHRKCAAMMITAMSKLSVAKRRRPSHEPSTTQGSGEYSSAPCAQTNASGSAGRLRVKADFAPPLKQRRARKHDVTGDGKGGDVGHRRGDVLGLDHVHNDSRIWHPTHGVTAHGADDSRLIMDWRDASDHDVRAHVGDAGGREGGRSRFFNNVAGGIELNTYVPMEWGAYVDGPRMTGRFHGPTGCSSSRPHWKSSSIVSIDRGGGANAAGMPAASPGRRRQPGENISPGAPKFRVDALAERPERQQQHAERLAAPEGRTRAVVALEGHTFPPAHQRMSIVEEDVGGEQARRRRTNAATPAPSRAQSPTRDPIRTDGYGSGEVRFRPLPVKGEPPMAHLSSAHSPRPRYHIQVQTLLPSLPPARGPPSDPSMVASPARVRQLVDGLGLSPRVSAKAPHQMAYNRARTHCHKERQAQQMRAHPSAEKVDYSDPDAVHPAWKMAGVAMASAHQREGYKQWTKALSSNAEDRARSKRASVGGDTGSPLRRAAQEPHVLLPPQHPPERSFPWLDRQVAAAEERQRQRAANENISEDLWRPAEQESKQRRTQAAAIRPTPKRADQTLKTSLVQGIDLLPVHSMTASQNVDIEALLANEIRNEEASILSRVGGNGPYRIRPAQMH